jgi:ABC-2 type transport system ATP-binding protein
MIGVVPQQPNLDFQLTAREILTFHGAYFGLGRSERNETADRLLTQFQLNERADQLVQGFSGGMSQRLSIARALVHDPDVLFLDEPSAGLDPQTRLLLWEIVREYNRVGKTVLLTTHYMEEADALCDRIAIIDHGRIIAQGTPLELKAGIPGGYLVRMRFASEPTDLLPRLEQLTGVREVRPVPGQATAPDQPLEGGDPARPVEVSAAAQPGHDGEHRVDIYADRGGTLIPEIAALAADSGIALSDMHIEEPSLETLFLHHTGRSLRE